jgi:hypothetical protein
MQGGKVGLYSVASFSNIIRLFLERMLEDTRKMSWREEGI